MTSEATLYENARIDAAIVSEVNETEHQPFLLQTYASAIRRTRSISLLAGNGEPDLRETAALIGDDAVEASSLRRNQDAEHNASRTAAQPSGLQMRGGPRDHNCATGSPRDTANSEPSLPVTETAGAAGAQTIGERQGAWLQDGRLRWDISQLPARTRAAIENAVDEMHPKASRSAHQ